MTAVPDTPPVVIDLLERRLRRDKDTPVKRRPRDKGRERRRTAHGELAVFVAGWEPLHQVASQLPHWRPGDRGRPPDLPPAAHLLFGIMYVACHCSDRQAEAELRFTPTWREVRRLLVGRYPEYRGLQTDAQSPSRSEFWRFRERYGITDDVLMAMRDELRGSAAEQALGQGQCTGSGGSLTHPAPQNTRR